MSVLEIRSYVIRPGLDAQFRRVMQDESLPMLEGAGHDVVAFHACLHTPLAFVLMRAYRDLAHRNESQEQFYSSDAWRNGPRPAVLDCIEVYTSVIIGSDDTLLANLRRCWNKG